MYQMNSNNIIYLSYIYHISIIYLSYRIIYGYLSIMILSKAQQAAFNRASRIAIQGIEEALSDFEAKISDLVKGMLERRLHPINVLVMIITGITMMITMMIVMMVMVMDGDGW